MKLRHASIVWAASAAVMLAGLGLARAQQQPQQPNVPGQVRPGLIPPIEPGALRPPTTPITPRLPPPTPPGGTGVPGAGGTGNIAPFETGVDYRPTGPGQRVTFNLEDADLPDLVRLVSTLTGKRFIIGGKTRSIKASVYAPTKVTAGEAYQAFLSILQMNGMTVVPSGRYLKIVETTGIENLPVPTYTGGEATAGDERYLTRMHRLENVAAEDVATLLSRFKSREGNVTAYAPTNTVIITDMGSNIRRMLRIVEAIDVPRSGEQIWIEQIHYANATEIAQRIGEIFPVGTVGGGGGGARAARPTPPAAGATATPSAGETVGTVGSRSGEVRITKILPDERTNSLIIVATERAYLRILEIIRMLDVPLEGEGGVHVHYVQHGDAEDIAQTLSQVTGASGGAAGAAGAGNRPAGGVGGEGGGVFEGSVRVTAHKATNSLVVTSSLHDYAALRRVIDRLDVRRRQVFLEAVIMDLSVTRSSKIGLGFHGGVADFPSDGSLSIFGFNAQASALPFIANQEVLQSLALGIRGPAIPESQQLIGVSIPAFGAVITALANSGDGNVLSTPHIIAMDNEEAEISVGQNVPLQTSGIGLGGSGLGGLAGLAGLTGAQSGAAGLAGLGALGGLGAGGFGAVPRQEVGTKIHLTPHLNESDEVRLDIDMEDSDVIPGSEGTLGVKSISKRTAKTKLVVRDQQTVVIGGLMRDSIVNQETKIPILGDIPLLGILFRQSTREHRKSNLLLFLTPYIIRSPADLRSIFERKMRERQEFIDRYFVFGDQEYEPPVDYSRTRGLLGEIFTELGAVDEEQRMLEAIRAGPVPEHVPRPPVGSAPVDATEPHEGDVVITPDGSSAGGAGGDNAGSPPPQPNEPPQAQQD